MELVSRPGSRGSPPPPPLPSLADQLFTVLEGAFLLTRALADPTAMRRQIAHLRHYLELLFGLPVQIDDNDNRWAVDEQPSAARSRRF